VAGRTVYDLTPIADWYGRVTGIQRVICEVLVPAFDRPGAEFVFWDHASAHDWVALDGPAQVAAVGTGPVRLGDPGIAELGAGDVFVSLKGEMWEPDYIDSIRRWSEAGADVVQVVYDMLPIVRPQFSGHSTDHMRNYLAAVAPHVTRWAVYSENTRRDLANWLAGIAVEPEIDVFRLGDDPTGVDPGAAVRPAGLASSVQPGGFVLCVGTIEGRKNHRLLYYAYRYAVAHGIELPELVIVGKVGWRGTDIAELLAEDPRIAGTVHVLSDLSDAGLAWCYANCGFTVYPSEYEGWGLPIAESLAWGKPVIAARTSSVEEIAGDLIDYIDPYSVEGCVAALARLRRPDALAEAEGRATSYRPTRWADSAAAFEEIIARAGR